MGWKPRDSGIVTAAALCLLARPAAADEHATPAPGSGETKEPTPLVLHIHEQGPLRPWTVTVTNNGDRPMQLVADPRLLWFEVKVPGQRKLQTCRLPDGLFPTRARRRLIRVLMPGKGVFHAFDPRWYCFAAGGQWRLVPGALITPHFGWPERTRTKWHKGKRVKITQQQAAPFVTQSSDRDRAAKSRESAASAGRSEPDGSARKVLRGRPFALTSAYSVWSSSRRAPAAHEHAPGPLTLELAEGSDAHAERSATVQLTLRNRSRRGQTVYFRRELVSFEVMGPAGLRTCDPEPDFRAPDRQAFLHLRPGRKVTITSRLVELCPRGTFSSPGLYLVHARLDVRHRGEEFGINAYVGRLVSTNAASIRIRTGEYKKMRRLPKMRRFARE